MTVILVVQFIEHNCVEGISHLSQSVAFFLLHKEASPEFAVPVVEATDSVTISKSFKNRWHYIGLLLRMNLPCIHLDPLVTKLFDVIDSLLVSVVNNLFSQIVAELWLSRVLTLKID